MLHIAISVLYIVIGVGDGNIFFLIIADSGHDWFVHGDSKCNI